MSDLNKFKKENSGFTLTELSVIIILTGMIVIGLVGGKSLVRGLKIKSIITQTNSFISSIDTFKLKYKGIPGDLEDAFNYWGFDCSKNDYECNGNGDEKIEHTNSPLNNEGLRAWQHLSLSKIINESYTGTGKTLGDRTECQLGINSPKSSITDVGFFLNNWKDSEYNSINTGTSKNCEEGFLTPLELFKIDKKYDDGNPADGFIKPQKSAVSNCYSDETKKYILEEKTQACNLIYEIR